MPNGYFGFVLHAHMPYVRQAGSGTYGEGMLHRAVAESYIPFLNVCYDLRAEGVPFHLTLAIPPILAEQLADADVMDRVETFLLEKIQRTEADVERFQAAETSEDNPQAGHLLYLARFYKDWSSNLLQSLRERFERDLVAALRLLQNEGHVEIVTGPATLAYLPLLSRDSTVYAQLKMGVTSYLRHFGRLPRGVWLPECGYRPAYSDRKTGGELLRPGLEEFLAELNVRYAITETHAIEGEIIQGQNVRRVGRSYPLGPHQRWVPQVEGVGPRSSKHGTFQPYYIGNSNVAVYGRDAHTGKQVWSASEGYPGDYVYREVQCRDERSGLQYWRVTGEQFSLEEKELYDPYYAFRRAQQHAAHFVEVVREQLRGYYERSGRPGVVVADYSMELFGLWWFEAIPWLKQVLLLLSQDEEIALTTAGEYLKLYPPDESITLPESSWDWEGDHPCRVNPETDWMWPLIHEAECRMEHLVARFPDAGGDQLEVLKQAARELLLLQCSDWPFTLGTQQVVEYAARRFQEHLSRFNRLVLLAEKNTLDPDEKVFLQECQHLDNPFLNMDYRIFAARGGQAE